jgi:hypothetical protein
LSCSAFAFFKGTAALRPFCIFCAIVPGVPRASDKTRAASAFEISSSLPNNSLNSPDSFFTSSKRLNGLLLSVSKYSLSFLPGGG